MVYAVGNTWGNETPQEMEPFSVTKSAGEREVVSISNFLPTLSQPAGTGLGRAGGPFERM